MQENGRRSRYRWLPETAAVTDRNAMPGGIEQHPASQLNYYDKKRFQGAFRTGLVAVGKQHSVYGHTLPVHLGLPGRRDRSFEYAPLFKGSAKPLRPRSVNPLVITALGFHSGWSADRYCSQLISCILAACTVPPPLGAATHQRPVIALQVYSASTACACMQLLQQKLLLARAPCW